MKVQVDTDNLKRWAEIEILCKQISDGNLTPSQMLLKVHQIRETSFEAKQELLRELAEHDINYSELAREMGVTVQTVSELFLKAGAKKQKPGRKPK